MMRAYIDIIRPERKPFTYAYDVLAVFAGSLFLALMAQIAFRLPFTLIPFSMQTFGVLLIGALLGSKRGTSAVLAYLAQGAAGFPVFTMGASGLAYLIGPTGGYLVGFAVAAFAIGVLLEKGWKTSYLWTCFALIIGTSLIYICGVSWLSIYVGSTSQAMALGFYPFLIGAGIKIALAALLIPSGWKLLKE